MLKPEHIVPLFAELDDFFSGDYIVNAPLNEALAELVALSDLKKELSMIYDSYAAKIAHRMELEKSTIVTLESGAEIKCMTGAPRKKWDNQNLMSVVYDRLKSSSIDMDTGEVGLSDKDIVVKLLDYLSPSYWRVKALNEIGINADMYCETGEPKTNIAIFGAHKENK